MSDKADRDEWEWEPADTEASEQQPEGLHGEHRPMRRSDCVAHADERFVPYTLRMTF